MLMLHAIRSLLGGSYRGPPRARSDDMGKNKGNVRFATGPGRSEWPGHGVRPCRTGVRDHPSGHWDVLWGFTPATPSWVGRTRLHLLLGPIRYVFE